MVHGLDLRRPLLAALLAGTLTACGGGGGGSGPPVTFDGFSALPADGTVTFQAETRTTQYTANLATGQFTFGTVNRNENSSATATLADGAATAVQVSSAPASVQFRQSEGDTFVLANGVFAARSAAGTSAFFVADPVISNFEHQTYGAWLIGTGTRSGAFGVGSFGRRTEDPSAVQISRASYTGAASGFFRSAATQRVDGFDAALGATVDFVQDSFSISTALSTRTAFGTTIPRSAPELNISGTGSLSGNRLSAAVANGNGSLSGDLTGWTYGPSATEIGGTFQLDGSLGEMFGSFGAAQSSVSP